MCLDGFGYLNLDRKGSKLLFQARTGRKEQKATMVATSSPVTEWPPPLRSHDPPRNDRPNEPQARPRADSELEGLIAPGPH